MNLPNELLSDISFDVYFDINNIKLVCWHWYNVVSGDNLTKRIANDILKDKVILWKDLEISNKELINLRVNKIIVCVNYQMAQLLINKEFDRIRTCYIFSSFVNIPPHKYNPVKDGEVLGAKDLINMNDRDYFILMIKR